LFIVVLFGVYCGGLLGGLCIDIWFGCGVQFLPVL
jgi:hypothetical protein